MKAAAPAMKPQVWFCEACGVIGVTMYEEHADVMSVFHKLGDAHRAASPGCPRGVYEGGLRVLSIENLKKDEILFRR